MQCWSITKATLIGSFSLLNTEALKQTIHIQLKNLENTKKIITA